MKSRTPVLLLVCALQAAGACGGEVANLTVPAQVVLGDPIELILTGSPPGSELMLSAEVSDILLREWTAATNAVATSNGEVRMPNGALVELLSAAEMAPQPDGWEPPAPRDFNEITWRVSIDGREVASTHTRLWVVPRDVVRRNLKGPLSAELFTPPDVAQSPGVLLLGGSGGGMQWARRTAALLARNGFAALAVAYFNEGSLPKALVEIPIEYVEAALDSLRASPAVSANPLALMGYSKGAELALLVATRRTDVGAVVAFAPGSAVFQGFRAPDYPVLSSWSEGGIGLPFVPNAYDDRFFETYDGMYLWYRTLAQRDLVEAAAIPVERLSADLLLISGVDDTIWPSTLMAEEIVARLGRHEFGHSVRHLAFPDAGHGIAAPPGEPLTSVSRNLGGTVSGNAYARGLAWEAALSFLRASRSER